MLAITFYADNLFVVPFIQYEINSRYDDNFDLLNPNDE